MRTPVTLEDLPIGSTAKIAHVLADMRFQTRLHHLGFLPGTPITLVRKAPLGDPLQVHLRGYHVAIRRKDARKVLLELPL